MVSLSLHKNDQKWTKMGKNRPKIIRKWKEIGKKCTKSSKNGLKLKENEQNWAK